MVCTKTTKALVYPRVHNKIIMNSWFVPHIVGTDPEDVIRNAFCCFDDDGTGYIHEDQLRELLTTMGDRFTDEEVKITNTGMY